MEGGSLFDALYTTKSAIRSAHVARQVAEGLAFLHSRRPPIAHRDIKSPNVLLDHHGDAKLADFGLAKIKATSESTLQSKVGSPVWMAPEIIDDSPYSTKADVYSYAIVLHELATRELPWKGKGQVQLFRAVTNGQRPSLPATLPEQWRKLIEMCWANEPDKRPTMSDVIILAEHLPDLGTPTAQTPLSPQLAPSQPSSEALDIKIPSGKWQGWFTQLAHGLTQHNMELTLSFSEGLVKGSGSDAVGAFSCDGKIRNASLFNLYLSNTLISRILCWRSDQICQEVHRTAPCVICGLVGWIGIHRRLANHSRNEPDRKVLAFAKIKMISRRYLLFFGRFLIGLADTKGITGKWQRKQRRSTSSNVFSKK